MRRHTESKEMIAMVSELKAMGIDEFLCNASYFTKSGKLKLLSPVTRSTAYGISAYANQMYTKYGDSVTIKVGYFDNDFVWHDFMVYGA